MLPFFILSLLLFLIVSVVILPGLMPQSSDGGGGGVASMLQLPSMFGALSALLLLLVCIPSGPLALVIETVKNL